MNQLSSGVLNSTTALALQSEDTKIQTVQYLLQVFLELSSSGTTSSGVAKEAKEIINFVVLHVSPSPVITQMFVEVLSVTEFPEVVIDVLATIAGDTEFELEIVIEKYKELINSDRKLLVPIIGSLSEFDLSKNVKEQAFQMCGAALSIVDETDVPTVVRTLLHTMTKSNAKDVIETVRNSTSNLSSDTWTILIEVIGNVFRINPTAVKFFLMSVTYATTIHTVDIILLLVLIGRTHTRKRAIKAIIQLISFGSLTLEMLVNVFKHDVIMETHTPSMVILCQNLLLEGGTQPFLLRWVRHLFGLLFQQYKNYGTEIVATLVSCCSSHYSTNLARDSANRDNTCVTAAQTLLDLAKLDPGRLSLYSSLIEEVIQNSVSLDVGVFHLLCHTLARLCVVKESLHNLLMIFIQKQVFSGNQPSQRLGIICASHVLRATNMSHPDMIALVTWVLRLLQSSDALIQLHIFDMIVYNLPQLPKDLIEAIFQEYFVPELLRLEVFYNVPDIPGSFVAMKKTEKFWDSTGKQKQLTVMISSFLERSTGSKKIQAYLLTMIFKCYLGCQSVLSRQGAVELLTAHLVPCFEIPEQEMTAEPNLNDSGWSKQLQSAWCSFYAFLVNVALLNHYSAFVSFNFSDPFPKEVFPSFLARLRSTVKAVNCTQSILRSAKVYLDNHKKETSGMLSRLREEYELLHSSVNARVGLEFDFTLLLASLSSIPLTTANYSLMLELYKMLYGYLAHSFSVCRKVSTSLHGLETEAVLDSNKQFVSAKLLTEEQSQQELLDKIFKSNVLSHTVQHVKTLNEELRKRRRSSVSARDDPLLSQQIAHILIYQYQILRVLLEFTRDSPVFSDLLLNLTVTLRQQTGEHDIRAVMEVTYQYLLSQLKVVEDSFIAVLIMETLILLTKGLKKVRDVSQICMHTLKIVYPSNSISLWASVSKEVYHTFFIKYVLHAVKTLAPHVFIQCLTEIMDEMKDLLTYQKTKSIAFPCIGDENFGSVYKIILHIATKSTSSMATIDTEPLLDLIELVLKLLELHQVGMHSTSPEWNFDTQCHVYFVKFATTTFASFQRILTRELQQDVVDNLKSVATVAESLCLQLKQDLRHNRQNVKSLSSLPRLIFNLEKFSDMLDDIKILEVDDTQMQTAVDLDEPTNGLNAWSASEPQAPSVANVGDIPESPSDDEEDLEGDYFDGDEPTEFIATFYK